MRPRPIRLALALASLCTLPAAQAATVSFDAGRLVGASGVVVDGTSYDVTFTDGTCAALFGGCDDAADFVFNTQARGRAASQALLDQVFNAFPAIDADPRLTRGCENSVILWQGALNGACWVLTPMVLPFPDQISTYMLANNVSDAGDVVPPNNNFVLTPLTDTAARSNSSAAYTTWAVWRAAGNETASGGEVPVPGSAALAALGLALLAGQGRAARRAG
jgi:hypothetical protein